MSINGPWDEDPMWVPDLQDSDLAHNEVTHILSGDFDTKIACDIMGATPEVTCLLCLGGTIDMLEQDLEEARHHLAMLNPEGWACLPNCVHCSGDVTNL